MDVMAATPLTSYKEDVTVRLLTTFKRLLSEGTLISGSRLPAERELAARAASRASARERTALRHEMQAMKENAGNHDLLSQHDLEFHKIIFHAAGSRVCGMLFTVVHQSFHKLIEFTSQMVSVQHTL